MYGGSVVESGATANVFAHRIHPYTLGLFAARPGLRAAKGQRLVTIPGTVPELADLPKGCPFAGRCRWTIAECDAGLPAPVEVDPGHRARCIRLDVVAREREAASTPMLSLPLSESAPTPTLPQRGKEGQP
jgi:peptide/nickel transport system ATP-binding protein